MLVQRYYIFFIGQKNIQKKYGKFIFLFTFAQQNRNSYMETTDNTEVKWYVLGSLSTQKELVVRDDLRRSGLESFVPLQFKMKRVRNLQHHTLKPAITGLIFVKANKEDIKEFIRTSRHALYMRKSTFSNKKEYLTVPNKQMENFITATEQNYGNVTYYTPDEISLHEGDIVKVPLGSKEYEGEIMRVKGKRSKQLVVSIPEVAIAAIELTPEILQLIEKYGNKRNEERRKKQEDTKKKREEERGARSEQKTKNLEMDKKLLFDTAFRLLFIIPDKYLNEAEFYITFNELKRIRKRISTYRGVIPIAEGELALAMYLASVKLDIEVEEAKERMKNAIERLKPNCLLRTRMEYYLARFSGNQEDIDSIKNELKDWRRSPLSPNKKAILQEMEIVFR